MKKERYLVITFVEKLENCTVKDFLFMNIHKNKLVCEMRIDPHKELDLLEKYTFLKNIQIHEEVITKKDKYYIWSTGKIVKFYIFNKKKFDDILDLRKFLLEKKYNSKTVDIKYNKQHANDLLKKIELKKCLNP